MSGILTASFDRQVGAKSDRQDAIKNQYNWARTYRTLEKPGKEPVPYDYEHIRPWEPMLQHPARDKLVFKSRKVTYTEQGINFVLYRLDSNPGTHAAYVRETRQVALKHMRERFDPAILDPRNPMGRRLVYDQAGAKGFLPYGSDSRRLQFLYAVGTKIGGKEEQAGDKSRGDELTTVFYDERQLQPFEMEGVIKNAVPLDAVMHTFTGGTPTVKGNILGVLWERSSSHLLLFECPACKRWQELIEDSILERDNLKKCYIGCLFCGQSLEHMRGKYGEVECPDTKKVSRVEWVPQKLHGYGSKEYGHPDLRYYLGFKLNRLCVSLSPPDPPYYGTPRGSTRKIVEDLNDPGQTRREKLNEILGVEYEGDDAPFSYSKVSLAINRDCSSDELNRLSYTTRILTYDWGKITWYQVWGIASDGRDVLIDWDGITGDQRQHSSKLIDAGLSRGCVYAVGDMGYAANREYDMQAVWGDRSISVHYNTASQKFSRPHKRIKYSRRERIAVADRNFVIEKVAESFRRGLRSLVIPGKDHERTRIMLSHYAHVIPAGEKRINNFQEIKQEKTKWGKTGADHYLHCHAYEIVAKFIIRKDGCVHRCSRLRKLNLEED